MYKFVISYNIKFVIGIRLIINPLIQVPIAGTRVLRVRDPRGDFGTPMVVATGQGFGFLAGIGALGGLSGLLWGAGGEVGHGKGCRAAGDLYRALLEGLTGIVGGLGLAAVSGSIVRVRSSRSSCVCSSILGLLYILVPFFTFIPCF